ncbi:MAG TPA: SDR family oxidoreductase [Acidobacteriaceae bacterium]|nr:SDR family oxidoreductase [Acidobacteriaceae bacterium]
MIAIDLSKRVVLITGALGSIALVTIARMAEAGAHLLLTDIISSDKAAEILRTLNLPEGSYAYWKMDVTDEKEVCSVVSSIFQQNPHIDICLGLAGGCGMHPFARTSSDEFLQIFNLNYLSQVNVTRAVLQEWVDRKIKGHMIYASSWVATNPWPDLSSYVSAKAALDAFAKCMALEYATYDIRFNSISPGHVAAGSSLRVYETDQQYRDAVDRVIPLGRLVRVEAVADAFAWLASPMASDVNGQVIRIDLGASIPKLK